jgi:hypothetical protein
MALGSRTSGVDGSSEGGRINTIDVPGVLVIYGVALVQQLQAKGTRAKLTASPVRDEDGQLRIELTYQGDEPKGVPGLWHGHRVIVKAAPPPPPPPQPARA